MINRQKPDKPYNGLTVVLSQPSRQDLKTGYLISGFAGIIFNEFLQGCGTSRWACDIRTSETINEPLLEGTKGIILLGEPALHTWCPKYIDYKLTEVRGSPLENRWDIPVICSFTPQDCCDLVNYEERFNPLLKAQEVDEEGEGEEEESKKRHGFTQRKNYRFWLKSDIEKILYRIKGGEILENKFEIRIYPRADEVVGALDSLNEDYLFFDIETDGERNITVIGFSTSQSNIVYSLPILDYNYNLYYGNDTYRIIRSLVCCLLRNTVVIHNSMFDLFVLLFKLKVPIGKNVWDTMLVQKRIFPEVEKSLGHCLSYYPEIWEAYHKDEGIFEPQNHAQERSLLYYNAKDVIALRLILIAQLRRASMDKGLMDSIIQANESVYPFLINSLTGVYVDAKEIEEQMSINDRLLNQIKRAVDILTGPGIDLLPSSSKSCVKYFHDILGYPVVGKSKKTGEPSLDETNLLKLKQKNPLNIVIDFCIKYRGLKKFSGSLKAKPIPKWHE